MTDENDDDGPFFRIYALSIGHVLTQQDVDDIQQVLADYNEELGSNAELYHQGRVDAFREIGGDALVAVMEEKADAIVDAAVKKALTRFYEAQAKQEE